MINFIDISVSEPYVKFKNLYDDAFKKNQKAIEAICISSYDADLKEADARFVNLKYIKGDEWIFFSNYNGPKAKQFNESNKISATLYWYKTNTQIRIKGIIKKAEASFSDKHFLSRDKEKNAIAISSNQSAKIGSYEAVLEQQELVLKSNETLSRPNYWGGYSFTPYYFEFWEGHAKRANKRRCFKLIENSWDSTYLQP